jgi:hypothetical protein
MIDSLWVYINLNKERRKEEKEKKIEEKPSGGKK